MNHTDIRVDQYISKSREFAIPVLEHLRSLVHRYCPQSEETMKWGFPHFMYRKTILCSMASFKGHCAFGFWNGKLMDDTHGLFKTSQDEKAMGQWGQIKGLNDLPADEIMGAYILQSMLLIDKGVKLPKKETGIKEVMISNEEKKVLKENVQAKTYFEKLSDSHKREYLEWVYEAKLEVTRIKRLNTMIEWLAEGKNLNWKYEQRDNKKAL